MHLNKCSATVGELPYTQYFMANYTETGWSL